MSQLVDNIWWPEQQYSFQAHENACSKCDLHISNLILCSNCVAVWHLDCLGKTNISDISDTWKCSDEGFVCKSETECEQRAMKYGESKHHPPTIRGIKYISYRKSQKQFLRLLESSQLEEEKKDFEEVCVFEERQDIDIFRDKDAMKIIQETGVRLFKFNPKQLSPEKLWNDKGGCSDIYNVPGHEYHEWIMKITIKLVDDTTFYTYDTYETLMHEAEIIQKANSVSSYTTSLVGFVYFPNSPQIDKEIDIQQKISTMSSKSSEFWSDENRNASKWSLVLRKVPFPVTCKEYLSKFDTQIQREAVMQQIIDAAKTVYCSLRDNNIYVDCKGDNNIIINSKTGLPYFIDLNRYICHETYYAKTNKTKPPSLTIIETYLKNQCLN